MNTGMDRDVPVVFIGSGEASLLERKVLIYSIRKNSPRVVQIVVFNGTHNTLEREGYAPEPAPLSLRAKYRNITEFSNYRFIIPQLCGFEGKAIYIDSDMICLADISDLFGSSLGDADFLAKAFTASNGDPRWGMSVTLFDCARARFELERYIDEIDSGLYSYNDLHQMTPRFLAVHPFRVAPIDPNWNSYDVFDQHTKLIHYTNLHSQPWKFRGHPYGSLWFRYLDEAHEAGFVSDADIELSIRRGYARLDLRKGNSIGIVDVLRNAASDIKGAARDSVYKVTKTPAKPRASIL